jgi:hypothetical protein
MDKEKMERYFSTGQSPQWAVAPMEEEESVTKTAILLDVSRTAVYKVLTTDTRCILWSWCCFLTMMQLFKTTIRPYTQPEVFSLGLRSTKMHVTSSLASTFAHLKCHRTTVASFREQGDKQIPSNISEATRRIVVQYSTRDYSELTQVYCKDTNCVTGKWWPNSILTLILLT